MIPPLSEGGNIRGVKEKTKKTKKIHTFTCTYQKGGLYYKYAGRRSERALRRHATEARIRVYPVRCVWLTPSYCSRVYAYMIRGFPDV